MIAQETVRHYQPEDVQAIIDIYRAIEDIIGADHWITPEILQNFLEGSRVDPATDTFVVQRGDHLIAYADFEFSPVTGRAWMEGVVDPAHWGEGIGRQIIAWGEARTLESAQKHAGELAADQAITLNLHTSSLNANAIHLFERAGYTHLRTFYRMQIEFDETSPAAPPPLPDGITLRPFDREQHARAVYEAHQEAFADHWGWEDDTFEEWTHHMLDYSAQDVSQWQIAWDGDEIAGISLNRTNEQDSQMGWIGTLGVRRKWRKRGLGLALLLHSFAAFQARGFVRAGLGVDASSLTNAVALYERAGMHVHSRSYAYRKVLRGTLPDTPA